MSLPKELPPVLTNMGQGNYPAGSNIWSGQPTGVAPAAPYFTPGQPPPAEYQAFSIGALAVSTQGVVDQISRNLASSWRIGYSYTLSGVYDLGQYDHDSYTSGKVSGRNIWLSCGGHCTTSTNNISVRFSPDGGRSFQSLGLPQGDRTTTGTDGPAGLLCDDSGNIILSLGLATTSKYYIYSSSANSWTPHVIGGGGTISLVGGYWDPGNSYFVIPSVLSVATIPSLSITVTSYAAGSPPGTTANLATTVSCFSRALNTTVMLPATQTSTGWNHVWRFTNPANTGTHTYPSWPGAATDVIVAVDYSESSNIFVAAVWDGTNTYFVSSFDGGSTWTKTGSILGFHAIGLACVDHTFIVIDSNSQSNGAGADTNGQGVWYSIDGGATWTQTVSSGYLFFSAGQPTLASNSTRSQVAMFAYGFLSGPNSIANVITTPVSE